MASAVAQAKVAAGKTVGVAGPSVIRQCLNLRLIDELRIELALVLLGDEIRLFDRLVNPPVLLDNPTVIEGDRVTHLRYKVTS